MRSATAVVAVLVLGMGVTGCGSGREQSAPSAQPTAPSPTATPSPSPSATPVPAPTPSRTGPSRAQVAWVAGMCKNRSRLTSLQTGPPIRGVDPGTGGLPPQFAEHAAMFNQLQVAAYLANARIGVRDLATRAARLPALGISAADAVPDAQVRRLQAIAPDVFRLAPENPRQPADEQLRRARRVATLFRSVGAPGPALQHVFRSHPTLAAAHRAVPDCR